MVTAVLGVGDKITLYYNPAVLSASCPDAQLVADEGAFSVWDKPPRMLCQGSRWGDHLTLNRWAEMHLLPQRPAFVVHRLDRMASGLVVIAHTKQAATSLSNQFAQRQVSKTYRCVVLGQLNAELPLVLDDPLYGKPALTRIEKAVPAEGFGVACGSNEIGQPMFTELELTIETGRKHQIRRHLADFGYPIAGDRRYGGLCKSTEMAHGTAPVDLQLRAVQLAFKDSRNDSNLIWNLDV